MPSPLHEACADIWLAASLAAHDFIPRPYWEGNRQAMAERYLPASVVRTAFRDGAIVGFSAVRGDALEALFVHPDYWNRGVGKELLGALFTEHARLELNVYTNNQRAVDFYRRAGFRETARGLCPHTGEPEATMEWRAGATR